MTSKALVIPFHRYTPFYKDNYRLILEYFKKEWALWGDEIDQLYFINSHEFLYPNGEEKVWEEMDRVTVISTMNFSHGDNLNYVIPMVKEDLVAIMDMDTVVFQKNIFSDAFKLLDDVHVAAYTERPAMNKISRFAPYFFFARMESLRQTSMNFDPAPPEHLDPLAKLTHELLGAGVTYEEIFDDRATIQMTQDGSIMRSFKFNYQPTGSYHLRNFNGGIHMVDSYNVDPEAFKDKLLRVPTEELTRIFGWNWTLNDITMKKEKLYEDILAIVGMKGIKKESWDEYIKEFQKFHSWIYI